MDVNALKVVAEDFVAVELTKELKELFYDLRDAYARLAANKLRLMQAEANGTDEVELRAMRELIAVQGALLAGRWELAIGNLSKDALARLPSIIAAVALI